MRLAGRGFILGGLGLSAGCATAAARTPVTLAQAQVPPTPTLQVARPPEIITSQLNSTRPLDPRGSVRKELLERATAALDIHAGKITQRDRMYLVDFKKFSGEERLYEVDLHGGAVTLMRTSHGRGSDPAHTGFATSFGNTPDSHMSSVGAYATAGASHGAQQGPNVLLDGLEYSNDRARERAILIHGADYADPGERMVEGGLLFAWA